MEQVKASTENAVISSTVEENPNKNEVTKSSNSSPQTVTAITTILSTSTATLTTTNIPNTSIQTTFASSLKTDSSYNLTSIKSTQASPTSISTTVVSTQTSPAIIYTTTMLSLQSASNFVSTLTTYQAKQSPTTTPINKLTTSVNSPTESTTLLLPNSTESEVSAKIEDSKKYNKIK